MSPKLPHLSAGEIVKTLESMGFVVARTKGSHIIMRRGSSGCVVPNHKEVKIGTLAGLLRQAGVETGEFLEAMKKG
ncbi:MAG: type II toxin-antitoxin system HicA family toxin [Candidatus Dadabacteria bacterium]|nr:type II toxin-antitoxin system HicA family toxin [Candidatus Dadabacteria bacterium]